MEQNETIRHEKSYEMMNEFLIRTVIYLYRNLWQFVIKVFTVYLKYEGLFYGCLRGKTA